MSKIKYVEFNKTMQIIDGNTKISWIKGCKYKIQEENENKYILKEIGDKKYGVNKCLEGVTYKVNITKEPDYYYK